MTPGASFRNLAEMQSSQVLGMTSGPTIRSQLDSLAMTVHEVVGRVELSGRSIINLEEDRVRGCWRVACWHRLGERQHADSSSTRSRMHPLESMQDRLKQVIQTQDDILNQRIVAEVSGVLLSCLARVVAASGFLNERSTRVSDCWFANRGTCPIFAAMLQCNNVRDDMNHKFALQVAENKRLQNQLAKSQVSCGAAGAVTHFAIELCRSYTPACTNCDHRPTPPALRSLILQADIQRLTRICENLATRVQILEANTGVQ